MNLKKILAGVVAGAMAVSAMAVASFAEADDAKKVVTVKGIREPYAKVCTSTGNTDDHDITFVVATADNDAAYEGKVTVTATEDSLWWTEKEVDVSDFIGDVEPDDVKSITFSSDVNFTVGYNTATGWGQGEVDANDQIVEDMLLAPIEVDVDVEVNTLVSGEFEAGTDAGAYAAVVYNAAGTETQDAALTIKDDDVIVASVTVPEGVDASNMVITLKGYTSAWGGWKDVSSEPGALSLETTVKAIREANGLENAEDLFGVNLEISGLADGAKVTYTAGTTVVVTLTDKSTEEDTSAEETDPEETEPETTTDNALNGDDNASASSSNPENQPTGIAIAIVPAVIAAAGVVISKKRK